MITFLMTIGGIFIFPIVIVTIAGMGLLIWLASKSNNSCIQKPYKKNKNQVSYSPPVQSTPESVQEPACSIPDIPNESTEQISSQKSEPPESSPDGFVPITVGDDELIAPPMAKSKLEWEEVPADDSDIISDEGQLAMLNEMAQEAEIRLARRMESY